jgi:hypothetical protein
MLEAIKLKYKTKIWRIKVLLASVLFLYAKLILGQTATDSLYKLDNKIKLKVNKINLVRIESTEEALFQSIKKTDQVAKLLSEIKTILAYKEQHGYPFAKFMLDSILVDSQGIILNLSFDSEILVSFDSIDLGGTANITKDFLHRYLGIKVGEPYNEKLIRELDAKLSELPYLQISRPSSVYFSGNKAKPYLYLENRKASTFDGVIGFAPNSQINNKLVITGDLNLKLMNLLGSGKNLSFSFKSFLSGSQDLQAQFFWPFFLKTKLGVDYTFKLLRFDSTYIDIYNDISLQFALTGSNYIKLFYQQQLVNVINPDTQFVRQTRSLPQFSDVRTSYYGLGIKWVKLDNALNPRKGYSLETDLAAGLRNLVENNLLKQVVYANEKGDLVDVYQGLEKSSLQLKSNLNASIYQPIGKHWVWVNQVKGGWVYNSQLFLNELYRIGGIKTLKGFDEQSIFASTFALLNIEMKYLFQQNSGFLLFANAAYYENLALSKPVSDWPWGIGAGLNLETGAGLFSLYYAVGSQKANPLEWRNAKIHFGLLNFF